MKKFLLILIIIVIIIIISIQICLSISDNKRNKNDFIKSKTILDRKNNISITEIEEELEIPKKIMQTHENIEIVPDYVINNIKNKNPNWEYTFCDKIKRLQFLKEEYGDDFVNKINSFKTGAHKADLFRLCWLYKYGGIYIDIDLEIIKSLDEIVKNIDDFTIMQNDLRNSYYDDMTSRIFNCKHKTLINSFIIVNKGNKYIKECIENIMKITQEDLENNYPLILFVMQQTFKDNINYQVFERSDKKFIPFIPQRMEIYDKYDKKIGYSCYKNYKNGEFK